MGDVKYKRMGDIVEGDKGVGLNGHTEVSDVYDVHVPDKMYSLRFANGSVIQASGNHLWYTETILDEQLHPQRIKEAKENIFSHIDIDTLEWANAMSQIDQDSDPSVDLSFLIDKLSKSRPIDEHFYYGVLRIVESIGPVMIQNYSYLDDSTSSLTDSEISPSRLYSLKLFCQQLVALYYATHEQSHQIAFTVRVGKVRTTQEISETFDLSHHMPLS